MFFFSLSLCKQLLIYLYPGSYALIDCTVCSFKSKLCPDIWDREELVSLYLSSLVDADSFVQSQTL